MKNLLVIFFVVFLFQNGFGQKNNIIGNYYNGLGTNLLINDDNSFQISHSPPQEDCILEIFSSIGKWKSQNDTIILMPLLDTISSNQFVLEHSSDTLSQDFIYFTIRSIFDNELLPFSNVALYSEDNKIIEGTTSDFDGYCKLRKRDFAYILVFFNDYYPAKIDKNLLNGNNFRLKITVGGRNTYLTENMYLLQKKIWNT